jgi:hypothetical protein
MLDQVRDVSVITSTIIQPSHLLRLLAKLRNHIWEHVLTTAYSLRYQDPASCSHFRSERDWTIPKQKTSKFILCCNPVTHTVKELHDGTSLPVQTQALDVFNQLKYVSKQLYQETNALELQFNDLNFACRSRNERPASFQMISFMDSLPVFQKLWLRKIVIDDKGPRTGVQSAVEDVCFPLDSPRTMAKLSQICKQNPQISPRYMITCWTAGLSFQSYQHDGIHFVLRGLCLESALRYQDLCTSVMVAGFSRQLNMAPEIHKWRRSVSVDSFQAPNLRFMPSGDLVWDAQAWHNWAITVAPSSPKTVGWVLEQVKVWVEQGI